MKIVRKTIDNKLVVRCKCGQEFTHDTNFLVAKCPNCGKYIGLDVLKTEYMNRIRYG